MAEGPAGQKAAEDASSRDVVSGEGLQAGDEVISETEVRAATDAYRPPAENALAR